MVKRKNKSKSNIRKKKNKSSNRINKKIGNTNRRNRNTDIEDLGFTY